MENEEKSVPVEVFSGDYWEASIIKEILEDNNIMVFLKDEIMGSTLPYYAAAGGAGAIKVVVSKNEEAAAIKLIQEYNEG